MSVNARWNPFDVAFYRLVVVVLRVINRMALGLRVRGGKVMPAGGVITVANHVHNLDATMVAGRVRGRVVFTSKPENLTLPIVGVLLRHLGVISVPRTPEEREWFGARLRAELMAGRAVHFFPEGELIRRDTALREFKYGAFRYAIEFGVPIVPMVFTYGRRNWWRRALKRQRPIQLTVLAPVMPTGMGPGAEAELMIRCRAAMESVIKVQAKATSSR